jgi:RNA polymerase subunit RPABC4/transcription elongation factor Spt4
VELIAIWLICGVLAAIVSSSKGRNGCGWFVLGFLFGPLGLLAAVGMSKPAPPATAVPAQKIVTTAAVEPEWTAACSACRSRVHPDATICPHCRSPLVTTSGAVRRNLCASCGMLIARGDTVCPHCGEPGPS